MKHVERLGREFARNWTMPPISEAEQDALAHAYVVGFKRALEHAASLAESLSEKNAGLALLLRAIGERKVEEDEP